MNPFSTRNLTAFAMTLFLGAGAATAADGTVTVVHGIPGLPAPVDVYANNAKLFSFDFGEQRGPLTLPAGSYNLEVRLQGNPVLKATADVKAGNDYTAIAHLLAGGQINLSLFQNDITAIGANNSRVTVRHLAEAPTVDVRLYQLTQEVAAIPNLSNPQSVTAELPSGKYFARIFAAGTTTQAFGPVALNLETGKSYIVNAVGSLSGNSFGLIVEATDLTGSRGMLQAKVDGKGCVAMIGYSPAMLTYDKQFNVTLSNAHPSSPALLMIGRSNTSFLNASLPFMLDSLGAPGCSLYIAPLVYQPVNVDSRGNGEAPFTIPASLAPVMGSIYFQYVVPAPGTNSLGLVFSDYLSLMEGSQS